MERVYNKLVRDNIPNIIKANGEEPVCRTLTDKEYWTYLLKKDEEELLEVANADSASDLKKELADKLEVIRAMADFHGFSLDEILEEANLKSAKNGAFKNRIFLEKVIVNK